MHGLRRRRASALAILTAIAGLSARSSAEAGFIASDLGPGGSFSTTSSYTLSGPTSASGLGYGLAVEFHVSGTSAVAFGSAELALAFHGGSSSAVDVLLLADSGGLPGSTLESIHLASVPAGPSLVTATSSAHTLLNPGATYWLAAVASGDTYLSWMANNQGSANDLAYRIDHGSGPTAWGPAPGNPDVAFAINAGPAVGVAVPSPPSAVLLGVGLLALGGWRNRRPR